MKPNVRIQDEEEEEETLRLRRSQRDHNGRPRRRSKSRTPSPTKVGKVIKMQSCNEGNWIKYRVSTTWAAPSPPPAPPLTSRAQSWHQSTCFPGNNCIHFPTLREIKYLHDLNFKSNGNNNNNVASMDSFSVADTLPVRKRPPKPPPFYFDQQQQQQRQQQEQEQQQQGRSKALVSIRAYEDMVRMRKRKARKKKHIWK